MNRFCPMCAWRKARRDSIMMSAIMMYLLEKNDTRFLFMTLTVPNVKGDMLNESIDKFNKDFCNLLKRNEFKYVKGYSRKLEITYNKKYNTYHPHFHVIIEVDKQYFYDSEMYMTQPDLLKLWRTVTGISNITQVKMQAIKDFKNDNSILEISKYSAKSADLMYSQKVFDTFYSALKGKQYIVFGGSFKDAVKLYKNGDLDYLIESDNTKYVFEILFRWYGVGIYRSYQFLNYDNGSGDDNVVLDDVQESKKRFIYDNDFQVKLDEFINSNVVDNVNE